jgi:DNA replication protein DnaC
MNSQNNNNLQFLLKALGIRVSLDNIPNDNKNAVTDFLTKELDARSIHKVQRLLRASGLSKHNTKTFAQFDWTFNQSMPKHDILAFKDSSWLSNAANLVLIGDPGIGKSHIAKALCYEAILQGYSALFISAFDLLAKIKKAPFPDNKVQYFAKAIHVLCIDELGYTAHLKNDTDLLFQIISKRTELLPTIITSNLLPKDWGSIFSGTAASAILDRLNHNGKFLTWQGKSYRQIKN